MPAATSNLITRVRTRFRERHDCEPRTFFAPGRINLVGAHLDYNGGDVLPMAVDRGVYVAAARTDEPVLELESLDLDLRVRVAVDELSARAQAEHGWAAYPLGVWREFAAQRPMPGGVSFVFGGDVPMASGMSSSAALEVSTAAALEHLFETGFSLEQLAGMAHRAEVGFVGVNCGIMDQYASALCRPDHALLLHCSGPTYEHVPLSRRSCEVLVMNTRKPRLLAESGFNERVAQCAEAHRILAEAVGPRPGLAHYTPAEVEKTAALTGVLRLRARHVVTEMGRISRAVAALRVGDVATLGAMLTESHRSTATDYAVSCEELDGIIDAALEVPGVFGARLTGAGFGGCAIALVEPGASDRVREHVFGAYRSRFGVEPGFDLLRPGLGVHEAQA